MSDILNGETILYSLSTPLEKHLYSEREWIHKVFGCGHNDVIVLDIESPKDFCKLLTKVDFLDSKKEFFISGDSWNESPGSLFCLPGKPDILIGARVYGLVIKKSNYPEAYKFISEATITGAALDFDILNNVFWDTKTSVLKSDIEFFAKSRNWFNKRGINYARSYMLYGPPGNGKTSAIRAICDYFETQPKTFSFTATYEDPDSAFNDFMLGTISNPFGLEPSEVDFRPRMRVLVLEDLDRFFSKEENIKTNVSLSTMLNAIDGVISRKNSILIATANCPEKMDTQVLLRPGRFDLRVPFESPSKESIFLFLKKITKYEDVSEATLQSLSSSIAGHSFAFTKGIYMNAASKAFERHSDIIKDEDLSSSFKECLENLGKDLKSSNKKSTGF